MLSICLIPRVDHALPAQGYSVLDVPGDPFGDGLVSRGGLLAAAPVFIVVEDDVLRATLGFEHAGHCFVPSILSARRPGRWIIPPINPAVPGAFSVLSAN